MSNKPNRLINETSPYLLQHANNPVQWMPWGDEAFEKAKSENKPIFLSIGYSTCHWCHVMGHESFEDEEVAKMMNDYLVPIKVDREERPDIDSIYMNVCQMLTGSGGWPLTVILTPDRKPFFAGTYFPKQSMHGRVGMLELIPKIHELWQTNPQKAIDSAEDITEHLSSQKSQAKSKIDKDITNRAFMGLVQRFDPEYGGFGPSPKFPIVHNLLFLLRHWESKSDRKALDIVMLTLNQMRRGGIYDHVGGGYHRYSTDRKWLLPHFEKMLYDQAFMTIVNAEAYQATKKEEYRETAENIIDYVKRDLTSPDGAFYSAEDADSDGEEGLFYTWTNEEIEDALGDDAELFKKAYGILPEGNFTEESTGASTGRNIIFNPQNLRRLADERNEVHQVMKDKLNDNLKKLRVIRNRRNRPHLDDKILTDWNSMMIAALAISSSALNNTKHYEMAEEAAEFIIENLSDGPKLMHSWRNGKANVDGLADDYAYFAWAMFELYQAGFEEKYLELAINSIDYLIDNFSDFDGGLFLSETRASEDLIYRPKEIYDGAVPSANSVALNVIARLWKLTGSEKYQKAADDIISAFAQTINSSPSGYVHFISGIAYLTGKSVEIVIAGKREGEDTAEMLKTLHNEYAPSKTIILRPDEEAEPYITRIAPFTRDQMPIDGKATAYVCRDYKCSSPTTDPLKMIENIFQ